MPVFTGLGLAGAAIGSAAASAAGGIIGSIASADDRDKAEQAMAEAIAEIDAVGADPSLQQEIILEKFRSAGIYTPEMEQTVRQSVSETAQLQEDPTGRDAQLKALSQLGSLSETGLGAQERAAYNEMREKASQEERSRQAGIMQEMAQRGQAGGGAELAGRLLSSQATSNQERAGADRMAASAADRALNALSSYGNLGGTMRSADFDVQKTKASAADELNRFNVQNQRDIQMRNIASGNTAQRENLSNAQDILNKNTNASNIQDQANRDRERQKYTDKIKTSGRKATARGMEADVANAAADRTAQGWQSAGSAVAGGISAISQPSAIDKLMSRLSGDSNLNLTEEELAELARKGKGSV